MRRYVCEGMLTQPNNSLKGFGRLSSAVGIFWKVLQCKLSLNRPVVTETQSNSLWGLPVCFGLALWKSQRGCVWSLRQNCPLAPDGYQTPKRNRRADTEERGCVDKTVNRVDIAQLYTTHLTHTGLRVHALAGHFGNQTWSWNFIRPYLLCSDCLELPGVTPMCRWSPTIYGCSLNKNGHTFGGSNQTLRLYYNQQISKLIDFIDLIPIPHDLLFLATLRTFSLTSLSALFFTSVHQSVSFHRRPCPYS